MLLLMLLIMSSTPLPLDGAGGSVPQKMLKLTPMLSFHDAPRRSPTPYDAPRRSSRRFHAIGFELISV